MKTHTKKINFERINAVALGSFESLLRQWLPDGKKTGAEFSAYNPNRNDSHVGSFTINIYKGIWKDFASGDGGSDPVSLYAYLFHNDDQAAAAKELGEFLGVVGASGTTVGTREVAPAKEPVSGWQVLAPPEDAPAPPKAHPFRRFPTASWCYRSLNGAPLGYVCRFEKSDGGKETLPLSWCQDSLTGATEWRWLSFAKPRWLYGLDRLGLKPDAPVLIVEGEKCADAAATELPRLACLSWPGGGKAVDKADWSPLAGRDVIIWPDCDSQKDKAGAFLPMQEQPGFVAAAKIAATLQALGCRVWMMPIEDPGIKKSGWDIADAIDEGLRDIELHAFIRTLARPVATAGVDDTAVPPEPAVIVPVPVLLSRENIARLIEEVDPVADFEYLTDDLVRLSGQSELPSPSVDYCLTKIAKKAGVPKATLFDVLKAASPEGIETPTPPPADAPIWTKPAVEGWEDGLIYKPRGGLEDCRENVYLVLYRHPAWVGVIGWNDFTRRIEKIKPTPFGSPPGEWKTSDDYETGLWLAQQCDLLIRSEGAIMAGVAMCADKTKFHPPREWLECLLAWDGVPRLENYLADCVGCDNTRYAQLVGKFFMIGLVARIFKPGCSMQYMPILEGLQGIGKSSLWRTLGGEWFQDTPLKLGDKDAYLQLTGVLIYEIAEMDSFNKAESTLVKGFITQENDRFREPYARRPVDNLRQCVFVGTTNHGEYLKDTTGNRRFWPIRAVYSDTDLMKAIRDMLFAEALFRFQAGERWHPTREEEREHFVPEQDARRIVDPWLYPLQDYLDDVENRMKKEFTVTELLIFALKVELNKIDGNRGMATRIGNLMAELGWERKRRTTGRREWAYHRPDIKKDSV